MFLRDNVDVILHALASPFGGWLGVAPRPGWQLRGRLLGAVLTACLLSLSLAAAAVARARSAGPSSRPRHLVYLPVVVFILARLCYYLAFVKLPAQGFWYYVDLAVALTAIILLQIDGRACVRSVGTSRSRRCGSWSTRARRGSSSSSASRTHGVRT
jgi:hypothetical protein